MPQDRENDRMKAIKQMITAFCDQHLTEEYSAYAHKLCDALEQSGDDSIWREKIEIWAASIIHVIARLNLLYEKNNEDYLVFEDLCEFFNAEKSTVISKSARIQKILKIRIGQEGYCRKEISDTFSFFETSEGFMIPKGMLCNDVAVEFADDEESQEINRFAEKQKQMREEKERKRKQRRVEINRDIDEKKKRKKKENDQQLSLFSDG